MMRRSVITFGLLLATCLAGAQGPDIARQFVLTERDAVGVLSPRVVCGSKATSLLWSTDGSILLARRTLVQSTEEFIVNLLKNSPAAAGTAKPLPPSEELVFYSPRADKVRAVVPLGDPGNRISNIEWVPGSQQVLIQYEHIIGGTPNGAQTIGSSISLVSSDGRVTPLRDVDAGKESLEVSISPNRPIIALISEASGVAQPSGPRSITTHIFNAAGKEIATDESKIDGFSQPTWGADGGLYLVIRKVDRVKRKVTTSFHRIDLATGKVGPEVDNPHEFSQAPAKQVVQLLAVADAVKLGEFSPDALTIGITPAERNDTTEFAVISTDCEPDSGSISPSGDAVAYISRGIALVRPLTHIPKDLYLQARDAARRTETINQAKQVGLGFLMFASDNDDVLPGKGTDLSNAIGPYLRDTKMLNGFVYSFGGGNVNEVEEPASTPLGYIPGKGGMAIVYIDGHVKWQKS